MSRRSTMQLVVGAVLGAVTWTATEYASHRWILHGRGGTVRGRRVRLGGLHRAHHRDPMHTALAARAAGHAGVAAGAALVASALVRVAPTPAVHAAATAFSLGYSTYEINHWNLHHRPARTRRGRMLRARHDRHHHGAPAANLGVTFRHWDRLLGTESIPQTTS